MKKNYQIKIVIQGEINLECLSIEEQKSFYTTLLSRILELYKKQKEHN